MAPSSPVHKSKTLLKDEEKGGGWEEERGSNDEGCSWLEEVGRREFGE